MRWQADTDNKPDSRKKPTGEGKTAESSGAGASPALI